MQATVGLNRLCLFRSPIEPLKSFYSQRKAFIGSILVALRAGSQHASMAARTMTQGAKQITIGSFALKPNKRLAMMLRRNIAPTTPMIEPAIASLIPC